MIVVDANVLHHDGILIPEKVYIRTTHQDNAEYVEELRVGPDGNPILDPDGNPIYDKYMVFVVGYKAWLESKYNEINPETSLPYKFTANDIVLDEFDDFIILEYNVNTDITQYTILGDIYKLFNEKFKQYMIDKGIPEQNISIE